MAKSMVHHDQRHTELYQELRIRWVQQTNAYLRSVRLYQEGMRRVLAHRARPPKIEGQPDLAQSRLSAGVVVEDTRWNGVGKPTALDEEAPPPSTMTAQSRNGRCAPLTARQREIAELIAQGLTNEQIAARIVVSRGTVGNHIGHMLRRLGMKNRAQIAAWEIRKSQESGLS